jgi:isopentenyl diphosphate isomerase/L-lactate dehydrogenase-like FMN-dependent dehydrogenase
LGKDTVVSIVIAVFYASYADVALAELHSLIKKRKTLTNGRPFLIKGIQSVHDAQKAVELGCDGIVVSNHAGRQVDGAVGSLDVLPEVSVYGKKRGSLPID